MDEILQRAVDAMRAEFRRQADSGNASYNGVAADGLDSLEGYFDLVRVAEAALAAAAQAG